MGYWNGHSLGTAAGLRRSIIIFVYKIFWQSLENLLKFIEDQNKLFRQTPSNKLLIYLLWVCPRSSISPSKCRPGPGQSTRSWPGWCDRSESPAGRERGPWGRPWWGTPERESCSQLYFLQSLLWCCREPFRQGRLGRTSLAGWCRETPRPSHSWRKCLASRPRRRIREESEKLVLAWPCYSQSMWDI